MKDFSANRYKQAPAAVITETTYTISHLNLYMHTKGDNENLHGKYVI